MQATSLMMLALAAVSWGQGRRDDGVRAGEYFRVVPHFKPRHDAWTEAALEAAEAAWEPALEAYGIEATPGRALRVHLYRSREEFDQACFRCEGRTWPHHSGLTSGRYGIALVLIGRGLSDEVLDEFGLPDDDLELIAHEATHLIGWRHVPEYSDDPEWFTEGIAEAVALRTYAEVGRPSIDSRDAWLQDLRARAEYPSVGKVVSGEELGLDHYRAYGVNAALVETGLTREAKLLARLRQGEALEALELRSLDRAVQEALDRRKPSWAMGDGVLCRRSGRWALAAREDSHFRAWHLATMDQSLEWSGGFERAHGTLEFLLGRLVVRNGEDWSELVYAVRLEEGRLSVIRHQQGSQGTNALVVYGETEAKTDEGRLEVSYLNERLEVRLGEARLDLDIKLPDRRGLEWGLGASPGSYGFWTRIEAQGQAID